MFQVLNILYYGSLILLVARFKHARAMNGWGKQVLTKRKFRLIVVTALGVSARGCS